VISLSVCEPAAGGAHVRRARETGAPPPGSQKEPPPHAPAHGYRATDRYNYYPDVSVYLDIDRRLYFYLEGGEWIMCVSLPDRLRFRLGDHVTLEMNTDKPYEKNKEHKVNYPPGQFKRKDKKQ
jgi:hypothetical protein